MKQNKTIFKGLMVLVPALMLPFMLLSSVPTERQKVVFEGEQYTVHYEKLLGRLDGHYVSYHRNGMKRSEGYFESNQRTGTWTVWDSTGKVLTKRQYTDPYNFIRLVPAVPDHPPVQLLGASPYTLTRNEHNYFGEFYLEERMVMYARRVWRQLTPHNNKHLFQGTSLFQHMVHHAQQGDITVYREEDMRNPIAPPVDAARYEVIAYKVVEDHVFDRERFVSETRIISICPVVVDRESFDTLDLFWIYLPRYRRFLAQQPVTGNDLPAGVEHLDDLLFFRSFHGEIYKSDNVYDRAIAEYKQGEEIALEAQRIETGIIEDEHDLWVMFSH